MKSFGAKTLHRKTQCQRWSNHFPGFDMERYKLIHRYCITHNIFINWKVLIIIRHSHYLMDRWCAELFFFTSPDYFNKCRSISKHRLSSSSLQWLQCQKIKGRNPRQSLETEFHNIRGDSWGEAWRLLKPRAMTSSRVWHQTPLLRKWECSDSSSEPGFWHSNSVHVASLSHPGPSAKSWSIKAERNLNILSGKKI